MSDQQGNQPEKSFRAGSVSAAIWANRAEKDGWVYVRRCVRFQKRFRDKDGNWVDSDYYFPRDLPNLQLVATKAFEHCALQESSDETEPDISPEADDTSY